MQADQREAGEYAENAVSRLIFSAIAKINISPRKRGRYFTRIAYGSGSILAFRNRTPGKPFGGVSSKST